MKEKIDEKRWEIAQESEKDYWNDEWDSKSLKDNMEEIYKKKLDNSLKIWQKYIKIGKDTKILQIGCGPLDIINYFKTGKRYSIDPLADLYKQKFNFDYKSTNLKKAGGEDIPFPDKYFDLVIINNVIDHTYLPKKVLQEIKRVLKDDGIMNLDVQVYQKSFLILAKIWGFFKKRFTGEIFNIHHPYMFHAHDIDKLVKNEFNIVHKEFEDKKKLKEERKKQKFTLRFLSKFGILGNIFYTIIATKK
jgi:ubiquinone/menaquinone biosynthesis C-methylase UbiE